MKKTTLVAALCGLSVFVPVLASAQYDDASATLLGPYVGLYFPQSSELRDIFGSTVLRFGAGPIASSRPKQHTLQPDLSFVTASKNGSKFFLVPITAAYEHQLVSSNPLFLPYVRFSAGVAYYDIAINRTPTERVSEKTWGAAGGVEVGALIAHRWGASLKYNVFEKKGGFDFNGLTFSVSIPLGKV